MKTLSKFLAIFLCVVVIACDSGNDDPNPSKHITGKFDVLVRLDNLNSIYFPIGRDGIIISNLNIADPWCSDPGPCQENAVRVKLDVDHSTNNFPHIQLYLFTLKDKADQLGMFKFMMADKNYSLVLKDIVLNPSSGEINSVELILSQL